MNDDLRPALAEALDYLRRLSREGSRPAEAQNRLRHFRECHPSLGIDLLWEEQVYDGSVHYDVLLHRQGEGTVSLSYCPDRALPWPLRGVHRWSEQDLLRVNHTVMRVYDAIACLDFLWDETALLRRLIDVCLIREELEREPIELSDDERQRALDAFRRARKLHSAEETRRWMERRGLTPLQLEQMACDAATVARVRDRVTAGRVEDHFAGHRDDFETACVARIDFPDEPTARRASEQARAGQADFYELARRRFLAAAEGAQAPAGELFAVLRRGHAPAELASAVFAAAPGDVVGPVPVEGGFALLQVLSRAPAQLDGPTRAAVQRALFDEWLEERRERARVEWCWGNAARTPPAGTPAVP